jgi:hypothetical protein
MKHTTHLVVVALAAAIAPLCVQAQKHPRTAWGDPDLTGAYSEFTTAPLERAPEYGEREFLMPEEYEEFAKRRLDQQFEADDTEPGTQEDVHYSMGQFALSENEGVHSRNLRTSIVTQPKNGRIPPLTAAAAARRDARAAARRGKEFDGAEMRSLTERCVIWPSTQPPILPRGYNSNLQIFQSPGYVVVQGEMGDPRVIPTDGRKLPDKLLPQWNGTSVGRWEDETFVIETAGFHPDSAWRNASENMRVTERITRVDEDTLEYAFTVTDPATWAEPWGGVYPLTKLDGLLYEYACTEGNYGMANILSGARVAEREAAGR